MRRNVIVATLAVLTVVLVAGAAPAQQRPVEVRTWDGQSWRLTDATFEVLYTIAPPAPRESLAPSEGRERLRT